MKKLLILVTMLILSAVCFAQSPPKTDLNYPRNSVQTEGDKQPVTITAGDLKIFRQTIAEKQFFENKSKILDTAYQGCQENFKGAQELYLAEKRRADEVLAPANEKLTFALKEKDLQIINFQTPRQMDKDENARLKFDNEKLKTSRLRWGIISFGAGLGIGGLAGNRLPRF